MDFIFQVVLMYYQMITTRIVKNAWQSVIRSVKNVSGNKSTVLSGKGFEKAILEIPHQVHDVVSKTRRTEGYHRRIRTSKLAHKG